MPPPYHAVLFDLDGTLLDSAPDIAAALNAALAGHGVPRLATERIVALIGKGAPVLVARALEAADADAALAPAVLEDYLAAYEARMGERGRLYPGAGACLEALAGRRLALGVVTNKTQRLAGKALRQHGIAHCFGIVVGGDRLAQRKPRPEPLLFACRQLGTAPERTLMVGDSINDVQAARAAGCQIVCLTHGYNEGAPPETLDAPLVDSLPALSGWIAARMDGAEGPGGTP